MASPTGPAPPAIGRAAVRNKEPPAGPGEDGWDGRVDDRSARPEGRALPAAAGAAGIGSGGDRLGGLARGGLAGAGGGNGQVGLVLPLPGPRLARPALQRDGAHRRSVLV